jgi:hypothetical protein
MKGASAVRDGEIEVTKTKPKTMKPADHPTGAELRRRRDLVWLYLASIGMTSPEIERACSLANRKQSVIRHRLNQARQHYERAGRG